MLTDTCTACGATYSAPNEEEFLETALAHFTEVHPEWGLQRVAIENYYAAKERLSDVPERLEQIGEVEVHQVTPERIDDVLRLFDRDAFAGKPEWASCYCMEPHREDPRDNGNNPWTKNRSDLSERLKTGATTAYLAYVDGKPAGWCNASVRSAYPWRKKGEEDDEVGSVVCFVVTPAFRKHGLSRKLLEAAIEGFRSMGMKRVEAYPRLNSDDDAGNFLGPLSLYTAAGFEIVEQNEKLAVVTKTL